MKKLLFVYSYLLAQLYFSCTSPSISKDYQLQEKLDSIRYRNLILSSAFGNPALAPDTFDLAQGIDKVQRMICNVRKEVIDSSLGITTRIHEWDYTHGYSYRKRLVYISNNKDFEFIFPFSDEYYRFHLRIPFKRYEDLGMITGKLANFETQLNYTINRLGMDRDSTNSRVNHILTLVLDSLLGMKEYKLSDTSMFRKMMIKDYNDQNSRCSNNQKRNIENAITEMKLIKNNNIRYFSCAEGAYAYWRVEIMKRDSVFYILPKLQNTYCYLAMYY